ncbi:unnamed protein product [Polarella glacialis]|uniref:Sulfate transporter n=1 Tax=Polarella glacialis TaxID=89957 RepID=A0A813DQX9_POLGL|nr:unnamed protein product [Polarella glacialis]CAE8737815.1 unnamed protein product [Polarella glacialis]
MENPLANRLLERERTVLLEVEQSDDKPNAQASSRWEGGDLVAPLVAVALSLPVGISCVGVAIAGVDALQPAFCKLLSTALLSMAISSLALARYSQFPTCGTVGFLTASYLGRLVLLMEDRLPSHLLLVHLLVAQALFTLMVGLSQWAIASMGVLWVTRFLPYPVIAGFNCAGALMIMNGGISLGTGKNIVQFATHLSGIDMLLSRPSHAWTDAYTGLAATILSASVFFTLKRLGVTGAAKLPLAFGIISSLFFGLTTFSGVPHSELVQRGFFLENISNDTWYSGILELTSHLSDIQWTFWLETEVLMLTLPYVCLVNLSNLFFLASLHEVLPPDVSETEPYVFEKEIRLQSKLNVLVGMTCGTPVSSSLSYWLIIKQSGTTSRIWIINFGVTLLLLFFFPHLRQCLGFVPRCAFSALVFCMGFDFFLQCFLESRRRIAATEWRFTAVTMVVTFFNVFAGILLGILLTASFFLVEYSTMTGLVRHTTLSDVRSFASQNPAHATLLDKKGHEVLVFWCSGYIFFGTASTIVEQIQEQLDATPAVRAIIIDFEHVPAVDASGVSALMRFSDNCLKRKLPVSVCICGMTRRLRAAMREAAKEWNSDRRCVIFHDQCRIEGALAWAEQLLIEAHSRAPRGQSTPSLEPSLVRCRSCSAFTIPVAETSSAAQAIRFLCQTLAPLVSEAEVEAFAADLACTSKSITFQHGDVILKEGSTASSLHIILSGSVKLSKATHEEGIRYKLGRYHLNEEKGDLFVFEERTEVELKSVYPGDWLGTMEFCATTSRSRTPCCVMSARAGKDGVESLQLPFRCLHRAINLHPSLGLAFLGHISYLAGLESLELLGSTQMLPYRSSSDATFLALAAAGDDALSSPWERAMTEP